MSNVSDSEESHEARGGHAEAWTTSEARGGHAEAWTTSEARGGHAEAWMTSEARGGHAEAWMTSEALLGDYRMQWALSSKMVVNERHELMVSPYKLASGSKVMRRLLMMGRGGLRRETFHVSVERVRDLALVVRFCHLGQCELSQDSLATVLSVAEHYQVHNMITLCNNFIKSNITDDSCWNFWILLNEHSSTNCKDLVKDYIFNNIIQAFHSLNFQKLNCDQLYELLTDDKVNVSDEYALIDLIGRWIDYNPHKRANQIGKLIRSIRLGLLTLEQIETLWKNQIIKRTQSNECLTNIRQMRRYLFRNKRNLRPLTKCGSDIERLYQCKPRLPHEAIFVFGGWEAGSASGTVRIFNNRAQQWISYTNNKENSIALPRPLMSFGISLFQKTQVFILGGEVHQQQATQEVICYDFLQQKWINKAPMHEIRRDLAVVNLNEECIFAIGGDNNKTVLDSVEKFLPAKNQWIEVAPMLMMRSAPAAETLNGKIYVLGGYTESQMEALTASCEVYDASFNQWTFIKAMSQQRYYFNALTHEGYLYVIGGGDESQWSTVERYSPSSDLWSPMPSLLQQRADFTTCILEGEFYCLGGGGDSFCTAEVEKWRPDDIDHGWKRCMKLPAPTWGHRCVCVRGINVISPYLNSANGITTYTTNDEPLDMENDSDDFLEWLSTSNVEPMENVEII